MVATASASAQAALLTDLVPKSLYDANTVLAATSDDTPVALAVGANTLVGRAGGSISALAVSAAQSLLLRAAADLTSTAIGDGEFVGRPVGGNLGTVTHTNARTMLRLNQQTLTAAASITYDGSLGINATVTLNQAGHTLAFSNLIAGQHGTLVVIQDGSGSRTITTYSISGGAVRFVGGTAPTLSAGIGAVDVFDWYYNGTDVFYVVNGLLFS
jgi:hypothetical protein